MATFSINTGTSTESIKYDLRQQSEVDIILDLLYDNTNKEINPHDIRDAVLSDWSNSSFKQTTASGSSISYIGIDTLNPSDKDSKSKILLGKRDYKGGEILGTYSGLLNYDSDIFFYNTKIDTISNYETKISILSGTNSSLYQYSPYLQSQVVNGTESLSFDIVNPNGGTISFYSNSGSFSTNNIVFPTISESTASASNNKVLKYESNKLTWSDITYPNTSSIGSTGSEINIYGSPVNINGYPIEFSDSRGCLVSIGDITVGSTFDIPTSIVDMFRRIIYTYLPPLCSISILPPYSSGYVEVGTTPTIKIGYTIDKRSLPTLTTSLSNMIPGSYPPITTPGHIIISGTSTGIYISPITNSSSFFNINVSDGTQSISASSSIQGIYPYFYGFSSLSIMTTAGLSSLTKLVEPKSDKISDITGIGNLYFIYDSNYPVLSNIFDDMGATISSSFSLSTLILSSPTGLWASKQFKVYQYNGLPQIGPPSVNYQFKY